MEKPWFEHYEEGVPTTIAYPDIPLHQILVDTAHKYPDTVPSKPVSAARRGARGSAGEIPGHHWR